MTNLTIMAIVGGGATLDSSFLSTIAENGDK